MGFIRTAARYVGFMIMFRMLRFIFMIAFFAIVAFVVWGWLGQGAPKSVSSALHGIEHAGMQLGHGMKQNLDGASGALDRIKDRAALPDSASSTMAKTVVTGRISGKVYYDFADGSHAGRLERLASASASSGIETVCFTDVRNRHGCQRTLPLPASAVSTHPAIVTEAGDILIPLRDGAFLLFHDADHARRMIRALHSTHASKEASGS